MTERYDAIPRKLAAGILSGGRSSRMGEPKDRIILRNGKPMIWHVMTPLLAVAPVVAIAGPPLPLDSKRVLFLADKHPGKGPMAGLEAIVSSGLAEGYLIAACDQPLLTAALLRKLLCGNRKKGCFFHTSIVQPFPGYFPASWLPDVEDALNNTDLAVKRLIAHHEIETISISSEEASLIRSFDCLEQLQECL